MGTSNVKRNSVVFNGRCGHVVRARWDAFGREVLQRGDGCEEFGFVGGILEDGEGCGERITAAAARDAVIVGAARHDVIVTDFVLPGRVVGRVDLMRGERRMRDPRVGGFLSSLTYRVTRHTCHALDTLGSLALLVIIADQLVLPSRILPIN
eukprot:scaffold219653_cov33-Cyclotella_meneghiniana.AAC.2